MLAGMVSESTLLSAIRAELGRNPSVVVWRVAAGFDVLATQRYGLAPGCSDLLGVCKPNGRMLALEVKTLTGVVRPDQKVFLELVGGMGGYADVVRTVGQAVLAARLACEGADSPYRRWPTFPGVAPPPKGNASED